jgi:hypothetical protein
VQSETPFGEWKNNREGWKEKAKEKWILNPLKSYLPLIFLFFPSILSWG